METKTITKPQTLYPHIRIDRKTYEKLRRVAFKRRSKIAIIIREFAATL